MKLIPTAEEILEYNKKCAEFLGWVKYSGINPAWNDSYDTNKIHFGEKTVHLRYMKFHSDWNWIMEIIEAIEKLGFATKIDHDYCISNYGCDRCEIDTKENTLYYPDEEEDKEEPIVFELTKSKKEATINTINEFLIWYKEQTT